MKTTSIPRDPLRIPKPVSNPAAALIRDTLAHRGISQTAAAEAMAISKAGLSDVIRQQARFDFQKAHHAPQGALRKEVRTIA